MFVVKSNVKYMGKEARIEKTNDYDPRLIRSLIQGILHIF